MTRTNTSADRMGFMAMMLPVAALALYALAVLPILAGFPRMGFASMMGSILLLLLSIPLNAILAYLSRRIHRPRFVQALVGLVSGILLSAALLAAMRIVHLKKEAALQQLLEAEAGGGNE
jgi:hypothetical protein